MGEEEKAWGGVTDPSRHDEKGFRYLVHAFNPFAKSSMGMLGAQAALLKKDRGENPEIDKAHGDQSIDLYMQPERLAERVSLSMSLIDPDHLATWGSTGIIVEAPKKNIVITSPHDVGAMTSDPAFLRKQAQQQPALDGNGLLRMSSPLSYNEVVALANVDGSKLKLRGFYYLATNKGEPVDPTIARKMEMHGRRLGLPVIPLKSKSPFPTNEVQEEAGKLAVHLDGSRYLLGGYGYNNFNVYDEKTYGNFITPDELSHVLQFLYNQGFSDDRIEQIRRDHALADTEYHNAKFEFDEKGEVRALRKKESYGQNEQEYSVSSAGYAHVVRVHDQRLLFQKMMAESSAATESDKVIYRPVTRRQVEVIYEEAKKGLTAAQLAKAEEWAAGILPEVEQKSLKAYGRVDRYSNQQILRAPDCNIVRGTSDRFNWRQRLERRERGGESFQNDKGTGPGV